MMYFKLVPGESGDYVGMDGTRYSVLAARRVRSAEGVNAGYEAFASLEDALKAWGVEPLEQEEV